MDMPLDAELDSKVRSLNAVSAGLDEYYKSIKTNGMSREYAVSLESYSPGILGDVNMNAFTVLPSLNRQSYALEAIDWVRTGVIVSLIATLLGGIYKFYKWVTERISNYLDGRVNARINELDHADTVIGAASATAAPVEPEPIDEVDPNYRKLYSKIVHRSHHTLNPILISMIEIAKVRKIPDAVVEAAAVELELLYGRLGDDYTSLYMMLAMDYDGRALSGLLHVCDASSSSRNERMYDSLDIQSINNTTATATSLVNSINALTKRIKSKDVRGIPVNMRTLEARLAEAVETFNDQPAVSGLRVIVEAPTGFYTTKDDGETIRCPGGYKVENSDRLNMIYDSVTEQTGRRYSIWNIGDNVLSPARESQWLRNLATQRTCKAMSRQVTTAERDFNRSLKDYLDRVKKATSEINNIRNDVNAFKKEQFMTQEYEFDTMYLSGSTRTYTTSPIEQLSRSIKFVDEINRASTRQITTYISLDNAMRNVLLGLIDGGDKYCEVMKKQR